MHRPDLQCYTATLARLEEKDFPDVYTTNLNRSVDRTKMIDTATMIEE
jgi:hypothetical protein